MPTRKAECVICLDDRQLRDYVSPCSYCPFSCCKYCVAEICSIVKGPPRQTRLLFVCPHCRATNIVGGRTHRQIFRSNLCLRTLLCNCNIL